MAAVGREGAIAASRLDVRFWTAAIISSMADFRRVADRQFWGRFTDSQPLDDQRAKAAFIGWFPALDIG